MRAFMDKYLPSEMFTERTLRIYAETFTEDELKQLISFYSSPLGKKISSKSPEIVQKCMLMDHQVLVQHSEELQTIVTDSLK